MSPFQRVNLHHSPSNNNTSSSILVHSPSHGYHHHQQQQQHFNNNGHAGNGNGHFHFNHHNHHHHHGSPKSSSSSSSPFKFLIPGSARCWLILIFLSFQSTLLAYLHLHLGALEATTPATSSVADEPQQEIQRLSVIRAPVSEEERKEALDYVRYKVPAASVQDRPLLFFHIPKTAGTAVEYAAGERKIAWGSCRFPHKPKRDICQYPEGPEWPNHVGWWHLPRHVFPLASADPYVGADLFAVIRDPYDRMVSEFYYICTLKVLDWRPDQCNRKMLSKSSYMNSWLSEKLREVEPGTALGYLLDNGHFTPQYEFLVGPHQVRMVDHVLHLDETLASDFHTLTAAYGMPQVRLKKLNALGAESREESKLDVKDLDAQTLQWVHKRYSNDFELGFQRR